MGRSSKPRHARRRRPVRVPMMKGLHDEFAMQMHTAFVSLDLAPNADSFDAIAQIFNVIGLTIEQDPRFAAEAKVLASGAAAMNQIDDGYRRTGVLRPTELEMLPVRNAINVCDQILPRLDVMRLNASHMRLQVMKAIGRESEVTS